MKLESVKYSEYAGEDREWTLQEVTFDSINLIVGKNAAGKSRLLSLIVGMAKLLRGEIPIVFESGDYTMKLTVGAHQYLYSVEMKNNLVMKELLVKDGVTVMDRGENGIGKIRAEKLNDTIDFETPPKQLAANVRRDRIQHPFLEDLYSWASLVRFYGFGTPLGKDRLLLITESTLIGKIESDITDENQVIKLYSSGFQNFGEDFDKAILRDMASLGYDCDDVGTEQVDPRVIQSVPPAAWLFVKERDLKAKTTQQNMSQGMFRALSLVIHVNYCIFRKTPRTLLIDDIGEGLDFSRAHSFISLLIERAKQNGLQLLMTTNDRFVMNGVPLEHWNIISRKGSDVHVINYRNSPNLFNEFEELGLNNFDFFSTNFFEEGRK